MKISLNERSVENGTKYRALQTTVAAKLYKGMNEKRKFMLNEPISVCICIDGSGDFIQI